MSLRPADFTTREEAYRHINTKLRELEADMVFLREDPTDNELVQIANKWQQEAAELREVMTR